VKAALVRQRRAVPEPRPLSQVRDITAMPAARRLSSVELAADISSGSWHTSGHPDRSTMDISVRYTPDFSRTVRFYFYLHRKPLRNSVICWAFLILLGLAAIGLKQPALGVASILAGVLSIITGPVLLWRTVYMNSEIFLKEVEVTLTNEGIEKRTDTITWHFSWDMIERVDESNDFWIFFANKLTFITVSKQALSQEQREEVTTFIAAHAAWT
jgi:hypothetical protein